MMEIALMLISTIRTKLCPVGKIAFVWLKVEDKSKHRGTVTERPKPGGVRGTPRAA
jgi:hypothetical protein